jgi:hypothetical protein
MPLLPPAKPKPFGRLKLALVSDALTREALRRECRVINVTPWNARAVFALWKPDLLFVESAWQGLWNSWKFRIAACPDHPRRNNHKLRQVVDSARHAGIPTAFWCKEDSVHFERFIHSAKFFDAVFTVDTNALPRYRAALPPGTPVRTLMFGIQPDVHHPATDNHETLPHGCFLGSYSRHIHPRRREHQEMLFAAAQSARLSVYDRNSRRRSPHYRFPPYPWLDIHPAVPSHATRQIYQSHRFSLNVNTIEDSPTMCSRRLLEIMASGCVAVSTPAQAIECNFPGLCHVVDSPEAARELFNRLHRELRPSDRQMARAAAEAVLHSHTWSHRLQEVVSTCL